MIHYILLIGDKNYTKSYYFHTVFLFCGKEEREEELVGNDNSKNSSSSNSNK